MTVSSGLAAVFAAAGIEASANTVTRDVLERAVTAAMAEGDKAGAARVTAEIADKVSAATASAQERIKLILGGEHAKGREDLAQHLAFETDMDAVAAGAVLAKSPKAEANKSRLDGNVPNPSIASTDAPKPGDDFEAGRQSVLARRKPLA